MARATSATKLAVAELFLAISSPKPGNLDLQAGPAVLLKLTSAEDNAPLLDFR